jgi:sirohydrochlorin ferrochelatase
MRVIAAFLSPGGGHVKRDVPNLIATARAAHPDTVIELVPGAIGAEPELVDALVRATVRLAHDVDARPAG